MAYTRHNWQTGEAITASKMNNIEEGLTNAAATADESKNIVGYTNSEASTGGSVKSRLSALSTQVNLISNQVDANLRSDLDAVKTQVNDARGNQTLAQTLQDIRDTITPVDQKATTALQDVNLAHRSTNDTLKARFEAIESENTTQWTAISAVQKDILDAAQGEDSLDINLTNIKNSITQINTELKAGDDTTSLQVKLKGLSDRITTEQGRVTSANTEIDNIKATLGYEITGNPSQTIKQIIENNASDAQTQSSNAESRAKAYTDTKISENNTSLDTRFNNIEANIMTIANELSMVDEDTIKDTNTRVDSIEASINDSTTGLVATKAIADEALQKANNAATTETVSGINTRLGTVEEDLNTATIGLKARVQALENAPTTSTTKVIDNVVYDLNNVPTNIGETPSSDIDYLLKNGDKYYYWKYINNKWELISGGEDDTTQVSSGVVVDALPSAAEADVNTDYFIYDEELNIYLHYRYIEVNDVKTPILIGVNPNDIKQYALSTSVEAEKNYIDFYQFGYGVNPNELDQGTRIAHIELVGGGGSGTFNTKQLTRITPRNLKLPIKSDERIYLRFFYTNGTANESDYYELTQENATTQSTVILGGGENTLTSGDPENKSTSWPTKTITVTENNTEVQKIVPAEPGDPECPVGFYAFDVTDYCKSLGKQTFALTITDLEDSNIHTTMQWNITLIDLSLSSDFTENSVSALGESVNFTYIPSGDIEKTAYFFIDDTQIGTQTLNARTVDEQTFVIPGYNQEGIHQLRVYLRASDNGNQIYSESIYRDLIWKDSASNTVLLSSPYRNRTINIQQYNTINIPYTIAGNDSTYTVQYYVNNFSTPYNEVILNNTNSGVWTYRPLTQGNQNLRINVNGAAINFTLNVIANEVDIAPYTNNLVLEFDPTGLSNNSASAKAWTNGTYHLTVSDNFDWYNGGYGSDNTGDYFLVKSGTRAYFDYKMFVSEPETIETQGSNPITIPSSKVYKTGQEMKIIFKTSAVRSIDAIWFTNTGRYDKEIDKEVGIQLSAHEGWLKTDTASDRAVGEGDNQVAATNTYLYFPYSEEDRIELDININKESGTNGAFAMSYEDGVPSKAYAYTHTQKLYHDANNPNGESIITIGSDDCDVYIYKLRIYNNELTQAQVLRNFIADGKTIEESIDRYQRNCIYYDVEHNEYSPYATSGFVLDPEALASKIPSVKVLMLDAPYFTENKKSFIKDSTLRCIHAEGPEGIPFRSRGAADNWFFENGYHAGQGTTSDKYGDSGRNIDFLFNCDGTHKPSNKVNPIADYKSKVTIGYGTDNPVTSTVTDWKGDSGKISLTENSIPNNFFNFKVNIASSENVNNALLQKRYNDFLPYISPAKARDARIKNDMEFVPAVLFVRENNPELSTHKEFNDTNWHYYALGNLGDSKKTDYTRAYDPTDMNEFTIEISDNNTNNSQFQTGVYMVNGVPTLEQFEAVQDIDDKGQPIAGSYTAQGRSGAIATTDYIYPLNTPELKALWDAKDSKTGEFLNKNHWSLVNEPYDGDHSFEMRYACCGDYRDGKLVNDTTGQGSAQRNINSKVWQAFYSWVVTSSNEEFVRDLDQWCVRRAVEFWYAFTHYYTMMDSRAKNTFWHFAKTGKYRKITNPIEDMFHVYKVSSDAQLVAGTTNEWTGTFTDPDIPFNASNEYYTEYAFDLWDYDNDTALGIDNNGELIFPYGKEDRDYKTAGDPASGYVFNGAGSVFWRRLSDLCTSEISNIFNTVSEQFFSANNLIEQFDTFQECYPEAIWQLDIQRKYIRPFTGDTSENAKTRQSKRFLESMMQGRKKYQRRQWIKDQYYYFGSKYKLNNITEDFFYLDCYTGPDDALITELKQQGRDEEAAKYVGSNWDLTITPYQDMYINASFGETAKSPVRARAGEPIEMTCPFTSMNNTRIYIYGASRLKTLAGKAIKNEFNEIIGAEGLASLYIGVHSIEKTDKLQHLYMGTDKTTYRNSNFTKLTLNESSPILETLDIRNCGSLAGELKLGGCNNLRTVEAEGTNISLITLPASSQIRTLHIPVTVTNLTLFSAYNLQDFYIKNKNTGLIDYTNLRSLIVDSSDNFNTINWINIAEQCIDKLNYLYLLKLKTSSVVDISELDAFATRKQDIETDSTLINLTGTISVTGSWSAVEKQQYETIWPDLTLDVTSGTKQLKHMVTYKYDDYYDNNGNLVQGQVIKQLYINDGDPVIDIWQYTDSNGNVVHILDEMPSRASTVRNNYSFGLREYSSYITLSGWKLEGMSSPISSLDKVPLVKDNLVIETYFYVTPRTYYVNWYLKSGALVKTSGNPIEYGGGYELEAPTIQEIHNKGLETAEVHFNGNTVTYSIFDGWEKLPTNITPSAADESYDIYAKWVTDTKTLDELFTDTSNLTPEQLLVLSAMSSTQKNLYTNDKISVGSKVTYTLGQDSIKEGTTLVGPGANDSILRLDFQTVSPRPTTITPLAENNEAFTLMIDYCFNADKVYPTGSIAAALVSCYEQNSSANTVSGFALYYNLNSTLGTIGPRIGFGDMFRVAEQSIAVGSASNANARNVVVLRHPKNSSTLYVYSGLSTGATSSDINVAQLTWNNTVANAVINFGQLTNNTSDEYTDIKRTVVNGSGTIYQVKYWNEDLGIGECKRLAAWPHENITYKFSYLGTNSTEGARVGINAPIPSINLTSITNSSHGNLSISTDSTSSTVGWGASSLRTFYNNRIFKALPTRLQAILCRASVAYKNAQFSTGVAGNTYNLDTIVSSTRDYVYAPSIINIQSSDDYINEDSLAEKRPYRWLSTNSDVEVYKYSTTTSNNWQEVNGNAQYKNLRFPYVAINWSQSNPLRIFDVTEASVTNFYNEINKIDGYIKVGDICLAQDGYAYIYVNTERITQEGAQAMPNDGLFATPNGNGGWIRAKGSCLRSISVSGGFRTRFGYITTMGIVNMSVTNSGNVSLGINYEFAI